MEALAIVGGIAAAATISADLLKVIRRLRKTIKTIRYARSDIGKMTEEMGLFAELFQAFADTCSLDEGRVSETAPSFSSRCLLDFTANATRGLRKLLRDIRALSSDPEYEYSWMETLTAHVKWLFSKRSVECLRASLSVARESINGFTNIRCIERLKEQLRFLKRAIRNGERRVLEAKLGRSVPEHMKMLEKNIENRCQMRRQIDKRLQRAKVKVSVLQDKDQHDELGLETEQLLDFTESLERYADEILPPRRSGHGTRRSYAEREVRAARSLNAAKYFPHHIATEPMASSSNQTDSEIVPQIHTIGNSPETPSRSPHTVVPYETPRQDPGITVEGNAYSNEPDHTSDTPSSSTGLPTTTSSTSSCPSHHAVRIAPDASSTRRSSRTREYMNDPVGNILSPPITKDRFSAIETGSFGTNREHEEPNAREKKGNDAPSDEMGNRGGRSRDSSARSTVGVRDKALSSGTGEASRDVEGEAEESESEMESESEAEDEDDGDLGPTPFQPVAPFLGRAPRGWARRREGGVSP